MTATADSLISKITAIFITLMFILLASNVVLAENTATSSTISRDARKANVQEKVATLKERVATKEAALKEKLAKFKDKQKAQIAERINTALANINEKITAAMSKHLGKMSGILERLEERVNQNTPDIKNPAAVKIAISDARSAIAAAEEATSSQAENDYVIEATSEARIRDDAKMARDKLHDDLKALREMVISAKQKVSEAIRVAKSNAGGAKENGQ